LYSNGTYTTLDDPLAGVHDTVAYGINGAGQIVGRYQDDNLKDHGFLYSGGSYITIDDPLAPTEAFGINDKGQIVGRYSNGSDMLLRNSGTGGFEVYDVSNNNITNAAFLGTVGLDWEVQGFGNFSGNPGESDMMLRNNSITGGGALAVYDIRNNAITGFSPM